MKNLIPKSFGIRRFTNIVVSGIAIIAAVGILFYQGTKKEVTVVLDGKEEIIRTHASNVGDILKDLEISVKAHDDLKPASNSLIEDGMKVEWNPAKQVSISEDGKEQSIWSTADTVEELLEEQGLEIKKHDKIKPNIDTAVTENMQISVEKAFSLTLKVGGEKQKVWSTSTTVADFLRQQGVKLNELDRVEPKLTENITDKTKVNVIRVEKVTDVVEEPIDYETITKQDSSLVKGNEKVLVAGKKGRVSKQYEVIKENGKEVKRKVLSEKLIQEERNQVVAVGTKESPKVMNVNSVKGRELYVTSTAYTASCQGCSGITATGINLKNNPNAKVIAVDPNVIPLGSKVYVEGYGYAIAADKGGAIKGNKIDVFISSKSAAYRWGVKKVKIKIID